MKIEHLTHLSKTSAALSLLSDKQFKINIENNRIVVRDERAVKHEEFDDETELMLWMYRQIQTIAIREVHWYNKLVDDNTITRDTIIYRKE